MKSIFYIFIPLQASLTTALESLTLSWVFKNINNELKMASGSLADAAIAAKDFNVQVILPGENVISLKADVPGKNLQRVQQAIPYVLEDSVIDDVNDLHFAIKKSAENSYEVAVVNKLYLTSIVQQLTEAGIEPDTMMADYMLLKKDTLLCDKDRVILNSQKLKFSSSKEGAVKLLENYKETGPLNLIYCADNDEKVPAIFNNFSISTKEYCNKGTVACLVNNAFLTTGINLLQGLYKKKKKWAEEKKRWLPVAIVFLIWLGLQGGVFVYDYINLSREALVLQAQINKIYKDTFPDAKRIVNAKAQMQQKLSALEKNNGQSGQSFSHMLAASADVLSKNKDLKIKSLRYYDGNINLELQLKSLESLEKLKQQLSNEKGFLVEIKNASSSKNTVTARLQITGAAL